MRRLYQNVDPNKNIGDKTGKEFSIFCDNDEMFVLYKDGTTNKVSEVNQTDLMEAGVSYGMFKLINEKEFLGL